jgi:hypothetical protein
MEPKFPYFKPDLARSSSEDMRDEYPGLTRKDTKNDWNIVLIANEYQTNRQNRALTLDVLGIAGTDTPMKTHHTLYKQ